MQMMIEPTSLHELAHAVRRLVPSYRDPEAFHIEKDRIERELKRLARIAAREARHG